MGRIRGSGWGKRRWVGQEEMGGFTQSLSKTYPCLGLAIERPYMVRTACAFLSPLTSVSHPSL